MRVKLAGIFYLMSFIQLAFAINATVYHDSLDNPLSSCMVLYFEGDKHLPNLCSGNIVGKDKLLTAGRCALKTSESAVVRCPDPDQRELLVKGQLVHSLYTKTEEISSFDHALLQVESDFFTFKPALLPKSDREMHSLMKGECAIFGYGLNSSRNSGSLLGASVLATLNSSLGFEMITTNGSTYTEEGDSGGGIFCRGNSHNRKGKWVQIATLSQTDNLNGERVVIAAPLASPITDWIERYLERELPLLTGFRTSPTLDTIPMEAMETPEDCLARLVQEATPNFTSVLEQIAEAELKQILTAEIAYQCGLKVTQEFLNPLIEEQKHWQQQQQQQLMNYASSQKIKDYRDFIKRELGRKNINRYCPDKNYESTVCGICELDLADCLLKGKSTSHKYRCEDRFEDCIEDAEEEIDEIHDAYRECDSEKDEEDIVDCIEDEIGNGIDRKLIKAIIDAF